MNDLEVERSLLTSELARVLGVRRTAVLLRVVRRTHLAPEALLDIALGLLDTSSEGFAASPIRRTAVGLGAARWRNVGPKERSETLRRAAEARWAKHRGELVNRNDAPAADASSPKRGQ